MATETKLFHLSDIHFGLEDNKALDWVKQEIAEQRPAAVAITGDGYFLTAAHAVKHPPVYVLAQSEGGWRLDWLIEERQA